MQQVVVLTAQPIEQLKMLNPDLYNLGDLILLYD